MVDEEQSHSIEPTRKQPTTLMQRAKNWLHAFGRPQDPGGPILSEALRFAINHKGVMERQDISALIAPDTMDLATYTLLKYLAANQPTVQRSFLESFTDLVIADPEDRPGIQNLQRDTLAGISGEASIIGVAKVAQVFREGGPALWEDKFAELTGKIAAEESSSTPVYTGYGSTLGLRQGINAFRDKKFFLLLPGWIKDDASRYCGYEFDLQARKGERVKLLPKNFQRPQNPIFVDDTRRTGASINGIWEFWNNNSVELPPEPPFRVVDTVNPNSSI